MWGGGRSWLAGRRGDRGRPKKKEAPVAVQLRGLSAAGGVDRVNAKVFSGSTLPHGLRRRRGESGLYASKGRLLVGAEVRHDRDDRDGDAGGDKSIFNGALGLFLQLHGRR